MNPVVRDILIGLVTAGMAMAGIGFFIALAIYAAKKERAKERLEEELDKQFGRSNLVCRPNGPRGLKSTQSGSPGYDQRKTYREYSDYDLPYSMIIPPDPFVEDRYTRLPESLQAEAPDPGARIEPIEHGSNDDGGWGNSSDSGASFDSGSSDSGSSDGGGFGD